MDTPKTILQHYWGYQEFRPLQEQIITSVLEQQNTIALLPTGGGKSLCFQIPGLLNPGICLVISPLIALMQDQVESLSQKNIKAISLPSGSTEDELIDLFDNIRFGGYKFLYLSPERLQSRFIQQKIKQLKINLIAIDEAHCISEWGHDFRPAYRNITVLKELCPNTTTIALTATATPKVIQDISENLKLIAPRIYKSSFRRNNLSYQILQTDDKLYKLTQILKKYKEPSIIYVNSRKKTKDISNYLNTCGFSATYYHAGLSNIEKQLHFNLWMNEQHPIMVATNAFGMGIDKGNVKTVIHYDLPNSIENFTQESGRAGRNLSKAFAIVLTNKQDIAKSEAIQAANLPNLNDIKSIHRKLYQHFQIAKGELYEKSFDFNLLPFCNKYTFKPQKTYSVLQLLSNFSIIEFSQERHQKSSITFLVHANQLPLGNKNQLRNRFVETLIRMYGGLFENEIYIDEFFLAKKVGISSQMVIKELEQLEKEQYIEYRKSSKSHQIRFLKPREDDYTINSIAKNINVFLKQKLLKFKALTTFISNTQNCRAIELTAYFGETNFNQCDTCDVCISRQNQKTKHITKSILELVSTKALNSKEICEQLSFSEKEILLNLRLLLSEERIGLTQQNKYFVR